MKVYFVRHGVTVSNKLQTHQDHTDPLNDEGWRQAKAVANKFKAIEIDAILSSDYIRASATAQEISNVIKKKVETTELLRERRRPTELVGKRYDDDHPVSVVNRMEENRNIKDWHHSDEENHHEAIERAQKLLKHLEGRTEKNILLVTHATHLRFIIACMIFGADVTPDLITRIYDFFRISNTGVTICEFKEGYRVDGGKNPFWQLVTWNDHSHLGEINR